MWRAAIGAVATVAAATAAIVGLTGPAQAAPSTAPAGDGVTVAVTYNQFVARHSGRCMTVAGGSQSNGANILEATCLGVGHQQWRLQSVGEGYYLIVAAHSGKCVDVAGQSPGQGIDVHQYACHAQFNQQWQRVVLTGGYSRFVARHSGRCLEVAENSSDLQQWTCSSTRHQEWRLA
jgi:hypothetical protein